MDLINVFIIIGRGYNKQKIVNEIREEGYKHNFFFGQGQDFNILKDKMDFCNECWHFGDASGYDMYEYAKKVGKDIWDMTT